MIDRGYYKEYTGGMYYLICTAIHCHPDNTQDSYAVYKSIDSDIIFCRPTAEFEEFVEVDGERLKRFKKLDNYIPTWPPTIHPYTLYSHELGQIPVPMDLPQFSYSTPHVTD